MSDNKVTQGGSGPAGAGEQGVPGGGSGTTQEDGSVHYTDWGEGSHSSYDEKGGEVSGEHTTEHSK
jgi:hypothetical protein